MAVSQWLAGMRITADRMNAITAIYASWTPTWTTLTGLHSPSFGNAVLDCNYAQTGNLVTASFNITFGSTTDFGASAGTGDNWLFSLPVTSAAASSTPIGFMKLHQSNVAVIVGMARTSGTGNLIMSIDSGRPDGTAITNTGDVDSLSPWTWASGNTVQGIINYQAA